MTLRKPRHRRRARLGIMLWLFLLTGAGAILLTPPTAAVAAPRFEVPVTPDRDQAQHWANEELSRTEYQDKQPSLVERFLEWLAGQMEEEDTPESTSSPLLSLAVGFVGLVVLVIALRKARSPLNRTVTRKNEPVFTGRPLTAADHRAGADRAAENGEWSTAVLERFRCIVRELEERSVLQAQPGRTADETAVEAALRLPELAASLRTAATEFDAVRYGDRPVLADTDRQLRDLDERIRHARVTSATVPNASALVPPG
jgi:hypothetical protein